MPPRRLAASLLRKLRIPSNAASRPDSVALAGIGVQPAVSLNTSAIDFGAVLVGQSSPDAVILSGTLAPLALVPGLSHWGLALLVLLLGWSGWRLQRRGG